MRTCRFCGFKETPPSWKMAPFVGDVCYCCSFWQPYIQSKSGLRHLGVHYTVAGDFEPHRGGMQGERWEFVLTDRRVLMCSNVTCQGAIPYRFQADLPNNVARLRTTWRGRDELAESLGFGNPELPEPIAIPKPVTSLFDLF